MIRDVSGLARSNERLREQQDALSSVLRAIERSAGVQPLLDEVTTAAMRLILLCESWIFM